MNSNSILCCFINNNIKDWKEKLEEKKIKVNICNNLAVFNYENDADFSDSVVQESRGIIINIDTLDVVCWPFRKFGNYNESYADNIDWDSACVQEKMDGSIIKLYWYLDKWIFATNATIDASTVAASENGETYLDLIKNTVNYDCLDFNELNKDYTYLFELIGPENKIVIKYNIDKLILIGQRNNKTGEECKPFIKDMPCPKIYHLNNLNECIDVVNTLNNEKFQHEGFVVVDKFFNRIKIKSNEYFMLHRTRLELSKKKIIELLIMNEDVERIIESLPDTEEEIRFYQYQYAIIKRQIEEFIEYARNLYNELNYERRAFAIQILSYRMKGIAFKAITNLEKSSNEIIKEELTDLKLA